jgi:hypothetical protein
VATDIEKKIKKVVFRDNTRRAISLSRVVIILFEGCELPEFFRVRSGGRGVVYYGSIKGDLSR